MVEKPALTAAEFGRRHFGSKHRLDILCTISRFCIEPPEVFGMKELDDQTDAGKNFIWKELDSLVQSGLISELERRSEDLSRKFTRCDDQLWEIFQVASEVIEVRFNTPD